MDNVSQKPWVICVGGNGKYSVVRLYAGPLVIMWDYGADRAMFIDDLAKARTLRDTLNSLGV